MEDMSLSSCSYLSGCLSSYMCGILLWLEPRVKVDGINRNFLNNLKDRINDRGPTCNNSEELFCADYRICLHSSVLSLRPPLVRQPIVSDELKTFLQYNGELYNDDVEMGNDTDYIFKRFRQNGVLESLRSYRGEYAFTYGDESTIWFGRDPIGRRSLLYKYDSNKPGSLVVSSVAPVDYEEFQPGVWSLAYESDPEADQWKEVPANCIFELDLMSWKLKEHYWNYSNDTNSTGLLYPYSAISLKESSTPDSSTQNLRSLSDCFLKSVKSRLLNIPHITETCDPQAALLFSGGLDCTLIAKYIDQCLPADCRIDLLNVSFENKRSGGGFETPDRLLGKRSWFELCNTSPNPSRFRFVEINVSYDEYLAHRPVVRSLIFPKNTLMDLDIAIAFYFASRGSGSLFEYLDEVKCTNDSYCSKAPVLFSGLGADELFAGYTRHANSLRRGTYADLAVELSLDFNRLHERNLGRDDRVCAHWGKEVRYPFLDESFINNAMLLPLNEKLGELTDNASTTKLILRKLAKMHNLSLVAEEKKRAIQFGAKSAKIELGSSKAKGQDLL